MEGDIKIHDFKFSSPTVKVEAISGKGKGFFWSIWGFGVVSVEMPKEKCVEFGNFAESKGMVFQKGF
jgi:hypothetical protein